MRREKKSAASDERWHRVRANIRAAWPEARLTDAELNRARGDIHKMVALLHNKTGDPQPLILEKLKVV